MEKVKKTTTTKKNKTNENKNTGLILEVFDVSGKVVDKIELSKEVFGVKPNKQLMAQAVRVYLANQRSGTADVKTRAEVRGGGRKPWRQKGTGRARIGSIRAPHWRGGGVVHGPTPKDYSLQMPKKMKKAALISALAEKFAEKAIVVLKELKFKEAKTKEAARMLKSLEFNGKSMVVVLEVGETEKRALRNLEGTKTLIFKDLNTYEVLNNKKMLITKDAILKIQETLIEGGK